MSGERGFSHLVVVGSSAGGIEALSRVLSSLPEDFPAPVVIAQHTHPDRESHLQDIFSRRNDLPVRTVTGSEPLRAGTVFVVPADRHVSITDSDIEVREDGRGRPKPSIDFLMETASAVYGENLIAVVLSGTGSDGTAGARAVKKAGGTVIVQNPDTAEFPGMPASIAPNTVDIVSELDDMGGILSGLLSGDGGGDEVGDGRESEDELGEFLEELKAERGIDFSLYKRPTIQRRLQRRFVACGVRNLDEYRRYLSEDPQEYRNLINSLLIKVTEFFRDPDQFDYLRREVLPGIVERCLETGEQLRIWSAGCATGEEAYSLAILVSDVVSEITSGSGGDLGPDVRIFGTDLDEGAISYARRGVYPVAALSGLSEEQIGRYFEQSDGLFYVKQSLRAMIIFGEHDLARRSPFPNVDLVVSRNVLIYFTPELQRRTLQLFAFSLKSEGFLMLGTSESVSPLSEYFAPADRQHKIFRRQGERFVMPASGASLSIPQTPRLPAHGHKSLRASGHISDPDAPNAPSRRAGGSLSSIPVAIIVVDRSNDIQEITPAARRLLSVYSEGTGEDVLHLVREAPYDGLRTAIDSAFANDEPFYTGEFTADEVTTGESRILRMVCHPYPSSGDPDESEAAREAVAQRVAIVVEDVTDASSTRQELESNLAEIETAFGEFRLASANDSERLRRQNERLVEGNRQLEAANRRLGDTVEELRYTSEQRQLSLEESQASAEEVETLNEELQATNEELETVNEELQATIEELNTSNEDLQTRSSQLKESALASEQEREQLKTILEGIPEPMLVVEASGSGAARMTNAAYREAFPGGCVALDATGNPLPHDSTPQSRASAGETFSMEFFAVGSNGILSRYEARANPVGDHRRRGGCDRLPGNPRKVISVVPREDGEYPGVHDVYPPPPHVYAAGAT